MRRGWRALFQQGLETGLSEMAVAGQRVREVFFCHHGKRYAICQRPVFVRALLVELQAALKPIAPGTDNSDLSGPFHKCIHVSAVRHSGRPEPAVALPDISIVPPESLHYLSVVSPSHLCKLCRGATVRLRRGNGGLRVRLRGRTREWAVGGWRGRRWQWSMVWK